MVDGARDEPRSSADPEGTDLAKATDEELLTYVTWRSEYPALAEAALGELHTRHAGFLQHALRRTLGETLSTEENEDVVQDVFSRLYFTHASKYRALAGEPLSGERQRRRVRAWLSRIAKNLAIDRFRTDHAPRAEPLLDEQSDQVQAATAGYDGDSIAKVQAAMARMLTPREIDVLTWSHLWYDPGDEALHVPDDAIEALAQRWDLTAEHIRAIRKRAIEKLTPVLAEMFPALASGATER